MTGAAADGLPTRDALPLSLVCLTEAQAPLLAPQNAATHSHLRRFSIRAEHERHHRASTPRGVPLHPERVVLPVLHAASLLRAGAEPKRAVFVRHHRRAVERI